MSHRIVTDSITGFGRREGKLFSAVDRIQVGTGKNPDGELIWEDRELSGLSADNDPSAPIGLNTKLYRDFCEEYHKIKELFCSLIRSGNIEDAELLKKELEELNKRLSE
jgi:hypothetical protein